MKKSAGEERERERKKVLNLLPFFSFDLETTGRNLHLRQAAAAAAAAAAQANDNDQSEQLFEAASTSSSSAPPPLSSISTSLPPATAAAFASAISRNPVVTFVAAKLSLDPTPDLFAIALAYFVQGVKMQVMLAESFFLKDVLKVSPASAAAALSIAHVPWVCKPLYGFVSDSFPLFGGEAEALPRRVRVGGRAGLCGALGDPRVELRARRPLDDSVRARHRLLRRGGGRPGRRTSPRRVAGHLRVIAEPVLGSAERRVDVDGVGRGSSGWACRPEAGLRADGVLPAADRRGGAVHRREEAGDSSSSSSSSSSSGNSSSSSGNSNDRSNSRSFNLLSIVKALRRLGAGATLLSALRHPAVFGPAAFIFCYGTPPRAGSAMFYFYTNELRFSPEFIGRINLLDGAAQLAGVALFNAKLKGVPLRKVFLWVISVGAAASCTQLLLVTRANVKLGIPDKLFVAFDSVLLTGLGRVALMPVLVLAARLCPPGVEATLYAALMSLSNAGGGVGEAAGAALTAFLGVTATDFTRLPLLVLICAVASVGPVLLLPLVGRSASGGGEEQQQQQETKRKSSANGDPRSSSELVPLKSDVAGDSAV